MTRVLTPRQQEFIRHFCAGGTAADAARASGYGPRYAKDASQKLLKKPAIAAEIARIRAEVAAKTTYDVVAAMAEADEGIRFSRETENATAMASFLKLKAQLMGLLVERIDQRQVGAFRINISGIDSPPAVAPVLSAPVLANDIFAD